MNIFDIIREFLSRNVEETLKIGENLGKLLGRGKVVALSGEFGAGKTTFIKGIAKGLGVRDTRYVNSPSFVIIKEYKAKFPVYHFDIHRLGKASDLDMVGYSEYFYGDGVTLIEWADKIKELLPEKYLDVHLYIKAENQRLIELRGVGEEYEKILEKL